MKAKIDNENKVKFFALYWGQQVLKVTSTNLTTVSSQWNFEHKDLYLELKQLSAISYEDSLNCFWVINAGQPYPFTITNIDYLRSKGYALPWMGLSVEDMVLAGWIKLIES
jgi:hypothetical protein